MCGRFTHLYTWRQLHRLMRLASWPPEELPARYNVAPTQMAPVVRLDASGARIGALLRWGLIPAWADDPSIGSRMINARAEGLASKPAFREAYKARRCLAPVSGFYEWRRPEGRQAKQPWCIHPAAGGVLCLAGLWERWERGGERVESFTIITTESNDLVRPLHDRMPAIIAPADFEAWLSPETGGETLAGLLTPAPAGLLTAHPVSPRVNSPRHDDPSLIEPRCAEGDAGVLFAERGE